MQGSLKAIRWSVRAVLLVLFLAALGVNYMAFAHPGELTKFLIKARGGTPYDLGQAAQPEGPKPGLLSGIAERNRAQSSAPVATQLRVVPKGQAQAKAEEPKAYAPPTARRKTIRVGE